MIFKRSLSILLAATMLISTSGCSAFRSSTETISVSTDQSDAEIYINGQLAGHGTAQMPVKRNQNVQIMAKKSGFHPAYRTVGKSLNNTGILDIIGGVLILLPLFGLLAPGAYSLDETNVSVPMVKIS